MGPLNESRSAPGGSQVVDQAANLTFKSACSWAAMEQTLTYRHALLFNYKVDTHLPSLGKCTAVSVQPVPKAAYHRDFRKKKTQKPLSEGDSILGPLAPEDSVLPLDQVWSSTSCSTEFRC